MYNTAAMSDDETSEAISSSVAAERAEEFMDRAVGALNKTRFFNKDKKVACFGLFEIRAFRLIQ